MNWKITILTRVKLVRSQFDDNGVQSRTFNINQNVGFFRIGKYQRDPTELGPSTASEGVPEDKG